MVWLRVRRWVVRPIVWAFALLAFLILALGAYLRTEGVRVRLARFAERELTRVVGRAVSIGALDFDLLPTRVVVRDLLVPSDRRDEAPFLEASEVRIELDADALRHDLVDLQTVSVRGLKVRLALRRGGDNLPDFARAEGGPSRFAVRVGGLYVEDGEIELDDQRVPLELSARAVMVRLAGLGGVELQGNVTAQEVETRLPNATPWPAAVSGKIRIESDRVEILSARVASAYLEGRAHGTIGWRGGTHGEVRAHGRVRGEWLDERGWLDGGIAGDFRYDGVVRFARRDLRIEGEVASSEATLFGFAVADLAGRIEGDAERIALEIDRGSYGGGPLSGRFVADLGGDAKRGRLELAVEGLPVDSLLRDLDLPRFRLASTVHGELAFDFPFAGFRRGSGVGAFVLRPAGGDAAAGLPGAGVLGLRLGGGAIEVTELALDAGSQRIDGSGSFALAGGAGRFDAFVISGDLDELARLQPFVAREPRPIWLPEAGHGELDVEVEIARGETEARLAMRLSDVRAPGAAADRVAGSLVVSADRVRDLDLELTRPGGRIHLSGQLPFDGGEGAAPAGLDIAFEGWPAEEAAPWLPVAVPLRGAAHGTLRLTGPVDALAGELVGFLSPVELAGVAGERLDLALDWNNASLNVERATLATPAGELRGSGGLEFGGERLDFRIATAEGGLDLSRPPFAGLWSDRLSGRLRLEGQVSGTLASPAGRLEGEIESAALLGQALDSESGAGKSRISAALEGGRLALDLTVPGLLAVRGGGPFVPGESAELDLDVASGRLDRWLELAAGRRLDGLTGALGARLAVRQSGRSLPQAELVADRLDLAHRGRTLALLEPARLRLDGERLRIESLFLGSPSGRDEIFVGGGVGLAAGSPLDVNVQAVASVDWFEEWTGLDFDGQIELLSKIGGTRESPEWNGEAALRGGRFIPPRLPHTVDRLEALALFYPDAIVLDSARGELAGGTLAAFGRVDLPRGEQPLDYRFQMSIDNASVRYPEGFLLRGGGNLNLQSSDDGRQIRGELTFSRIDYLQDIDLSLAQLVQRFLTRTRLQVEETDDALASTYLNVAVEGPSALRVRNNLARLDGDVELTVRGTLASPVLFGTVSAHPGGTIDYSGIEYTLERGILTFVNPSRIVPAVDIVTRAEIDDYDVRLAFGGTLDRLNTTMSSDPPLPEYDVLALLATGSVSGDTTFSGSGGGDPDASALAAESLLYGQAAALIGARVGTLFGVDRVRIEPLTTGDSVSAARVTVGKRLSRKIYVTYSVDPSSTAQQILEVEWRLSDELTLVLTQNGDGSYALDTRWGRRF
jgi:hypothetical protein